MSLYSEVIAGNIRLKEAGRGKKVGEEEWRPKTTPWETVELECGKKIKSLRIRRTRAERCPRSCGRRVGFFFFSFFIRNK